MNFGFKNDISHWPVGQGMHLQKQQHTALQLTMQPNLQNTSTDRLGIVALKIPAFRVTTPLVLPIIGDNIAFASSSRSDRLLIAPFLIHLRSHRKPRRLFTCLICKKSAGVTHGHAIGHHQRDYSYQFTPARHGLVHDTAECTHPIFGMLFLFCCLVLVCTVSRPKVRWMLR